MTTVNPSADVAARRGRGKRVFEILDIIHASGHLVEAARKVRRATGPAYADISLSNPKAPDLERIEVRALVDTGAATLCVLHRHGNKHDIWFNPLTLEKAPIPRHNGIGFGTVSSVCRLLGVPLPRGG